jgi:hypothetical protein
MCAELVTEGQLPWQTWPGPTVLGYFARVFAGTGEMGGGRAIASRIIANVRANSGAFVRAVLVAAVLAMPLWSS